MAKVKFTLNQKSQPAEFGKILDRLKRLVKPVGYSDKEFSEALSVQRQEKARRGGSEIRLEFETRDNELIYLNIFERPRNSGEEKIYSLQGPTARQIVKRQNEAWLKSAKSGIEYHYWVIDARDALKEPEILIMISENTSFTPSAKNLEQYMVDSGRISKESGGVRSVWIIDSGEYQSRIQKIVGQMSSVRVEGTTSTTQKMEERLGAAKAAASSSMSSAKATARSGMEEAKKAASFGKQAAEESATSGLERMRKAASSAKASMQAAKAAAESGMRDAKTGMRSARDSARAGAAELLKSSESEEVFDVTNPHRDSENRAAVMAYVDKLTPPLDFTQDKRNNVESNFLATLTAGREKLARLQSSDDRGTARMYVIVHRRNRLLTKITLKRVIPSMSANASRGDVPDRIWEAFSEQTASEYINAHNKKALSQLGDGWEPYIIVATNQGKDMAVLGNFDNDYAAYLPTRAEGTFWKEGVGPAAVYWVNGSSEAVRLIKAATGLGTTVKIWDEAERAENWKNRSTAGRIAGASQSAYETAKKASEEAYKSAKKTGTAARNLATGIGTAAYDAAVESSAYEAAVNAYKATVGKSAENDPPTWEEWFLNSKEGVSATEIQEIENKVFDFLHNSNWQVLDDLKNLASATDDTQRPMAAYFIIPGSMQSSMARMVLAIDGKAPHSSDLTVPDSEWMTLKQRATGSGFVSYSPEQETYDIHQYMDSGSHDVDMLTTFIAQATEKPARAAEPSTDTPQ